MSTEKEITSRSITLKRSVKLTVRVTEKFKSYMKNELSFNNNSIQKRIDLIEKKTLEAEKISNDNERIMLINQLIAEKNQLKVNIQEVENQKLVIDNLKIGDNFNNGMLEGFVNLKVGDDLYKRLGGMEIVIEDGIIQNINYVPTNWK